MPNIFSPNGDNINDHFRIELPENTEIQIVEMVIYNRWGNMIWKYKGGIDEFWDGDIDGQIAEPNAYVAKIRYRNSGGTETVIFKDLSLAR